MENKRLSEIIKEIEDNGALSEYYLHRNAGNGKIELNIEFNNEVADSTLLKYIKEYDMCANWE